MRKLFALLLLLESLVFLPFIVSGDTTATQEAHVMSSVTIPTRSLSEINFEDCPLPIGTIYDSPDELPVCPDDGQVRFAYVLNEPASLPAGATIHPYDYPALMICESGEWEYARGSRHRVSVKVTYPFASGNNGLRLDAYETGSSTDSAQVEFAEEEYDTGGMWQIANPDVVVIPEDGRYNIEARAELINDGLSYSGTPQGAIRMVVAVDGATSNNPLQDVRQHSVLFEDASNLDLQPNVTPHVSADRLDLDAGQEITVIVYNYSDTDIVLRRVWLTVSKAD